MRIAFIEIENLRGIKVLHWVPSSGVNCLIGPGDSTKAIVLDAVELCLNPRSYISPSPGRPGRAVPMRSLVQRESGPG
jgi:predicted ATP-dependent endonuclease of OLD family